MSPEQLFGVLLKLCGSASIWNKTAVPTGAFTELTPINGSNTEEIGA